MDLDSTLKLQDGAEIPRFGLGVYLSEPGQVTENAVAAALQAGYRHIDTAAFYRNEADVGRAVLKSGIEREKLFVTTKVWNDDQGYDNALRAFDRSLEELGLNYVDLYLIHWPIKDKFPETWKAMERIQREGRARSIGVSNFLPHHLKELSETATVSPVINQIELHPYLQQHETRQYCREHNIVVEAWAPIARGQVVDDPVLNEIAQAHGKTPVQVTLRWHLQQDIVVFPKSVHAERIRENAEVFDFQLSEDEMERINELDQEKRLGPHPDQIGGY